MARIPDATGLALSPLTKPSIGFSNDTLVCHVSYREGGSERREHLLPLDYALLEMPQITLHVGDEKEIRHG